MLKKLIIPFVIWSMLIFSAPSYAAAGGKSYDPLFALADVVLLRPVGLVFTAVGSAVFIGISPLTALASIAPPHDAFTKTAYALVMTPVEFTFKRPVGFRERVRLSVPPSIEP